MQSEQKENLTLSDYSKTAVLGELERILSDDLFSRSSVLSGFLKFIVEETLKGNTHSLKEYTVAMGALGKASDFDPQSNAIVRINAGRLRRLLKEYYDGNGIATPLKIEVIKGSYVPVFRIQVVNQKPEPKEEIEPKVNTNTVKFSRSKLTLAVLPFRNLLPDDEYQFFVDGFGEELTRIFSTSEDIAVVAHFSTLKYANHLQDIKVTTSQDRW